MVRSIIAAIAAMRRSSVRVTQVMGMVKTVPRQAQGIFSFFRSFMNTPIADTVISMRVAMLARRRWVPRM